MWHVSKLRQYLYLRASSIVIYGKSNSSILVFFSFFVWSFNCSSLALSYESHFRHFDKCGQCSNVTACSALSCIEKLVSTGSHYFLLVDKLYNLNVFKLQIRYFIRHVQKFTRDLYLRPFNAFSFTESSILTIKYVFSFSGL